MTQPTPTQTLHPWRATMRTFVAGLIGLLSVLPVVVAVGHFEAVPGIAQALGVASAVTRILAIPAVDGWLRQFVPWLAAQPKE